MRARTSIEAIAWVLGVLLLSMYALVRISFDAARAAGVEEFREASLTPTPATGGHAQTNPSALDVDQSLWSPQRIAAFAESRADQDAAQAVLRIPTLKLEVPVYPGTSESNLNRGAGLIEGTAPLAGFGSRDSGGNVGIAAHRDGFFRKLKDIAIEDELHIDTGAGTLTYRVVELSIVEPHDTAVLAPTRIPSVTLVTCFPFYFVGSAPQRYIVRAELET